VIFWRTKNAIVSLCLRVKSGFIYDKPQEKQSYAEEPAKTFERMPSLVGHITSEQDYP
jgi:hypothetical protein